MKNFGRVTPQRSGDRNPSGNILVPEKSRLRHSQGVCDPILIGLLDREQHLAGASAAGAGAGPAARVPARARCETRRTIASAANASAGNSSIAGYRGPGGAGGAEGARKHCGPSSPDGHFATNYVVTSKSSTRADPRTKASTEYRQLSLVRAPHSHSAGYYNLLLSAQEKWPSSKPILNSTEVVRCRRARAAPLAPPEAPRATAARLMLGPCLLGRLGYRSVRVHYGRFAPYDGRLRF
ncbi:hypothetical protein EVAR_28486_1 [Eumeta japonica]|uniref:Uncharacterized protein n=1 Tax=Eumeta variegata TaxID=151549 RepID=A0A4C1WSQ6_EUMVA|nr:hypothetical protein EVAR_28486_1 [Eumeta japonica]